MPSLQFRGACDIDAASDTAGTFDGNKLERAFFNLLLNACQATGPQASASSLTDSKGFAITPYDLTSTSRFKCDESNEDLFPVLMTSLDGTSMSFADALKPDQVWDLVHFVQTFRQQKKPGIVIPQPASTSVGHGGGNGNQ